MNRRISFPILVFETPITCVNKNRNKSKHGIRSIANDHDASNALTAGKFVILILP